MPFRELPIWVNRIAYREFTRDPELGFDEFKLRLGAEIFGAEASAQSVEDLLEVHCFALRRTWCQASPLVSPDRMRALQERHELTPGQLFPSRLPARRLAQR